jgi:hypothetical protein
MTEAYRPYENDKNKFKKASIITGASIPLAIEGINIYNNAEILSVQTDPFTTFEPGRFSSSNKKMDIELQHMLGDPDVNFWSNTKELEARLKQHAPRVLTISGLPAANKNQFEKNNIWLMTPCRPGEINKEGIYIITGDPGDSVEVVEHVAKKQILPLHNNMLEAVDSLKEGEKNNTLYENPLNQIKPQTTFKVVGSAALIMINSMIKNSNEKNRNLSRRKIFKNLIGGSAAYLMSDSIIDFAKMFIQSSGPDYAVNSTTQLEKNVWQNAISYTNDIPPTTLLNGRTAILTAKHLDAMDTLKEGNIIKHNDRGSLIATRPETRLGKHILRNEEVRDEAIRDYAFAILNVMDKCISDPFKLNQIQKAQLANYVLDYLSYGEIFKVNDPGIPKGTDLNEYVDTNIQILYTFYSNRIENAVKQIRNEMDCA